MPRKELVDIEGELLHQTDDAYLFFDGDKEVWLPKSLADWDPDNQTMTIPVWKAEQVGLV
jgi:hypothetical protein